MKPCKYCSRLPLKVGGCKISCMFAGLCDLGIVMQVQRIVFNSIFTGDKK